MKHNKKFYNIITSDSWYGNENFYIDELAKISKVEMLELLSDKLHDKVRVGKSKSELEHKFKLRMIGLKNSTHFLNAVTRKGIDEDIFKSKKISKLFLLKYIQFLFGSLGKYRNQSVCLNNSEFNIVDHVFSGIGTDNLTIEMESSLRAFMLTAAMNGWIKKDIDYIMTFFKCKLRTSRGPSNPLGDFQFFAIFLRDIMNHNVHQVNINPRTPVHDVKRLMSDAENATNQIAIKIKDMIREGLESPDIILRLCEQAISKCNYLAYLVTRVNKYMPEGDEIKVNILENYLSMYTAMLNYKNISKVQSAFVGSYFTGLINSYPIYVNIDPKFIIDNYNLEIINGCKLSQQLVAFDDIVRLSKAYVR